jgi:excisionase family DNA binding protein
MRTGAMVLRPRAEFIRAMPRLSENQLLRTEAFIIMKNTIFSLREILASDANVILQVTSDDLKMFAQDILIGAKSVAMLEAESAASGDQLLTIDEASKLLAVSKMTLYRWDQSGVLKKLEIGGKRRYRKSDIDRLVGGKM